MSWDGQWCASRSSGAPRRHCATTTDTCSAGRSTSATRPPSRCPRRAATASGPDLHRAGLASEAIRLARLLHGVLPDDGEAAGLLALILLTDARRPARTSADGGLVPLAEQDRSRWHRPFLDEGIALTRRTLARARIGQYQVQAALAAVHAEAERAEDTDWPQIVALCQLLETLAPNPMVTLNHAVAEAMVHLPEPDSRCWNRWTRTPGSPATTGSTRCGPTCWRWRATVPPRAPATRPRRD
ncbi:hypothetical protein STBA_26320 [Streptomyces sp. MP131-18]|nr:hypothetical protein STBA_26320 [Streptomyces sp. MP131-18]